MRAVWRAQRSSRLACTVLRSEGPNLIGSSHVAQRFCTGISHPGLELTFSAYRDVPELDFDMQQQFCMMTLRHPSFEAPGVTDVDRQFLYAQKKHDRVERVKRVFSKNDPDGTGFLDEKRLESAVSQVGLPANVASILGVLQRHNQKGDGRITSAEFASIVNEVWGKVPTPTFSDRLENLYQNVPGHTPLSGLRGISFIGRESPVNWTLRKVRNIWPYAVKRVAILRNTCDNPTLDPELMEVVIDTYEGGGMRDLNTTADLAELIAAQSCTSKGGFAVRLLPTYQASLRWPDGEQSHIVPLRGLGENPDMGMVSKLTSWFRS